MSWYSPHNVFKFFCWIGWHVWEYVYKGDGSDLSRQCKRCGAKQKHLTTVSGKWKND